MVISLYSEHTIRFLTRQTQELNMAKQTVGCYSTAGRGTEHFAAKELKDLDCIEEIRVTDGKVYFNICSQNLACLKSLRCVERIFLQITQMKTKEICNGFRLEMEKLNHCLMRRHLWAQCAVNYQQWKKETAAHFEESLVKRRRLDSHENQCDSVKNVSFRVSCKCSGRISRKCNPQDLSHRIGRKLSSLMGWQIDLRHPDMEVSVHLNDDNFTVGIPMVREPLSRRPYIRHHGLRSTVAWIMCSLADIQPGSLILDPLCGKATILIEGSRNWKDAIFVGVDKSDIQLKMASENIAVSRTASVSLIKADLNSLPIRCNSVDAVVCDLPFGRKHFVVGDLEHFYQTTLRQIDRVVKPSAQIVLLTSCEMEKVLIHQIDHGDVPARGDNCLPATDHNSVPGNLDPPVTLQTPSSPADIMQHGENQKTVVDRHSTDGSERSGSRQEKCFSEDNKSKILENENSSSGLKTLNVDSDIDKTGDSIEDCSVSGKKQLFEEKGHFTVFTSNGRDMCASLRDSLQLQWTVGDSFYIKLGETHSKICTFQKKLP
ncbi:uncharacterized protein LOC135467659 [Liolophura sinensis]|uniref:uncharacterized protein LOC135467659 n=1 Tax=Liolophura sinensis TaxID=3198878 RepID=UPI0031591F7E